MELGSILGLLRREDVFTPDQRSEVLDNVITNYVAFISYTILVWDHIITLAEEVKYIWFGRKGLLVYLFFVNRYFTPFSFIGHFFAYFSKWPSETCERFVRYEGACTVIAIEVTALMMLQRIRALYTGQNKIIGGVVLFLVLETGVHAWLLTHGEPVRHKSSAVTACTMIFNPDLHFFASLSAWLPLLYDTVVILLTLHKCLGPVKERTASHIMRTLVKDGLLYYAVIFSINLVLAVMIVSAQDGIKNITGQTAQLLTVAMMSRITLSLRREGHKESNAGTTSSVSVPSHLWPPGASPTDSPWTFRGKGDAQHASVIDIGPGLPQSRKSWRHSRAPARRSAGEGSVDSRGSVVDAIPGRVHRSYTRLSDREAHELRVLKAAAV